MLFSLTLCFSSMNAQRPEIPANQIEKTPPAPDSVNAKYEGGMFGFSRKQEGSLRFDKANERLAFYNREGKEQFSIPYSSISIAYPNSKAVVSRTGQVIGVVPYFGILGSLVKEKRHYLVIHFDDPDVNAKGIVNFKVEDEKLLNSVLTKLAQEAKLKQKGNAYYKPKAQESSQ